MAKTENTEDKSIVSFTPFGSDQKIQLSIEVVRRLIAVKTKTGKSPNDDDVLKFILLCQARRLNPFEGDAFLIGYDSQSGPTFSLITAHQAFLKRAEVHPEFDGMESGVIVMREGKIIDLVSDFHLQNDTILGGWAVVHFKHRTHPITRRLRLSRFNKQFGVWRDDPAGMITKCAEADALRSSFPTMLGGLYTNEEMTATPQGEIARPVFQETTTTDGEKAAADKAVPVKAEVIEEPKKKETKPREAVAPPPDLQRKSRPAPSAPTEKSPHQRFTDLLAVGNCTPQDFVKLALDEGWIDAEQGAFDKIPAARVTEFMKEENWNYIMQALDERAAKRHSASATRGELL